MKTFTVVKVYTEMREYRKQVDAETADAACAIVKDEDPTQMKGDGYHEPSEMSEHGWERHGMCDGELDFIEMRVDDKEGEPVPPLCASRSDGKAPVRII